MLSKNFINRISTKLNFNNFTPIRFFTKTTAIKTPTLNQNNDLLLETPLTENEILNSENNLLRPFEENFAANYSKEEIEKIQNEMAEINDKNANKLTPKMSKNDLYSITKPCIEPLNKDYIKRIQLLLRKLSFPNGWHNITEQKERFARHLYSPETPEWDRFNTIQYFADESMLSFYAVRRIFEDLKKRVPIIRPKSLLDFGAGTAPASLAANEIFPTIKTFFAIEKNTNMIALGKQFYEKIREMKVEWHRDYNKENLKGHGITVCAFSLSEIKNIEEREKILDDLWKRTKHFMVIVEAGEPYGFDVVNKARDFILKRYPADMSDKSEGANIISPCPHDNECPLAKKTSKKSWCQFAQRIPSIQFPAESFLFKGGKHGITRKRQTKIPLSSKAAARLRKEAKSGKTEGEMPKFVKKMEFRTVFEHIFRFSYLVLQKGSSVRQTNERRRALAILRGQEKALPVLDTKLSVDKKAMDWPRVLAPPMKRKKHVAIKLCTNDGIETRIITKSFGVEEYRQARKTSWGDLWHYPFRKVVTEKTAHRKKMKAVFELRRLEKKKHENDTKLIQNSLITE